MASEQEYSGGEQVSTPDPDKSTPEQVNNSPGSGNPLPEQVNNSPGSGNPLPDQDKAQRLADLVAATTLAASLPRHLDTARELAELRVQFGSLARDVRDLVNTLAEHAGNSRRRPNVVIISPGDQDAASIAADLLGND